jgi:hypothetical protein
LTAATPTTFTLGANDPDRAAWTVNRLGFGAMLELGADDLALLEG